MTTVVIMAALCSMLQFMIVGSVYVKSASWIIKSLLVVCK